MAGFGPIGMDPVHPATLTDLIRETDLSTLVSYYEQQVQPPPMSPIPSPDVDLSDILMLADTFQEQSASSFVPDSPLELPSAATAPHPAAALLQQRAQLAQQVTTPVLGTGMSLPSTPPLLFDAPSPGIGSSAAPNPASIAATAQLLAQSGILPAAWGAAAAPMMQRTSPLTGSQPPAQQSAKPFFTDQLPSTAGGVSLPFGLMQQGPASSSSSSAASPSTPTLSGPPSAAASPQLVAAAIAAASASSNAPNALAAILANPQAASILASSLLAGNSPAAAAAAAAAAGYGPAAVPAVAAQPAAPALFQGLPPNVLASLLVAQQQQQQQQLSQPQQVKKAGASPRAAVVQQGAPTAGVQRVAVPAAAQPAAPAPAASASAAAGVAGAGPTTRARASTSGVFSAPAFGVPPAVISSSISAAVAASVPAAVVKEERASAEAATSKGRRRQAKEESSEEEDDGEGRGKGNSGHNHAQVERKRRDLINERISQLKSLVPDLVHQAPNKATILGRAVDHMQDLIEANRQLQSEKDNLVDELERLRALSLGSEAGGSSPDQSAVSSPPQLGPGLEIAGGPHIPPKDDALLSIFRVEGSATAGVWPLEKLAQNTKQLTSYIAPDLAVPHMSLKQFIAAALKLAMENLIVTDPNRLGHPIVYASQGFQHMTGYSKEEILGRNCRFLQGRGTDTQAIVNIGQAIREGREYLTEVLNYRKDGTPFWNLVYITPVEDQSGRTTNYIGVQFDITASKPSNLVSMVSGALEQSPRIEMLGGPSSSAAPEDATGTQQPAKKQRDMGERQHRTTESAPNQGLKSLLASILHLSMSNLIVTDPRLPDNPIVYASPGFQKLTGYSKEEIVGHNCRFLQGPGTDQNTIRAISQGLKERAPFLAEVLNYRKDGTPFWNLLFITPVLDPQGQPFKFIGVQLDVTDHHA